MTDLLVPLVGAYFRPPAQQLLRHLPSGTELVLEPEPENPHDPNAIAVYTRSSSIPSRPDE